MAQWLGMLESWRSKRNMPRNRGGLHHLITQLQGWFTSKTPATTQASGQRVQTNSGREAGHQRDKMGRAQKEVAAGTERLSITGLVGGVHGRVSEVGAWVDASRVWCVASSQCAA